MLGSRTAWSGHSQPPHNCPRKSGSRCWSSTFRSRCLRHPPYLLTEAGHHLKDVIEHLGAWGVKWAFGEPKPDELDPALLVWKIHQSIDKGHLPNRRIVVQFDLAGRRARRLWLVLEPREVSVCLRPPGFDSDLILRADISLLYQVWLGRIDYDVAVGRGEILVEGPRDLTRALPGWFMWSPMARFVRECRIPQKISA